MTPAPLPPDPLATSDLPDLAAAETMLVAALGQIEWVRRYTLELLDATPEELWFEMPDWGKRTEDAAPGQVATSADRGITHVAWQVGHLAVSQYGLLMFRIHGRRDEDLELVPGSFRKAFGRGSDPHSAGVKRHSAEELRERLDRIHRSAVAGLREGFDSGRLLEPVDMPYAVYPIKLGAILFCPLHEQIHGGQIGLIRRGLGLPPIR